MKKGSPSAALSRYCPSPSKGRSACLEPGQGFVLEQWRQSFTYRRMVAVEPLHIVLPKQLWDQATGIDRAQGQGFETESRQTHSCQRRGSQRGSRSAPPGSWPVGTRLDGADHAHLHGRLWQSRRLIGNHLWPLMDIHEIAHAMPGAMPIVDWSAQIGARAMASSNGDRIPRGSVPATMQSCP